MLFYALVQAFIFIPCGEKLFWSAVWLWTKVAQSVQKLDIEYFKLAIPVAFQELVIKAFSPEMGIIGFRLKFLSCL